MLGIKIEVLGIRRISQPEEGVITINEREESCEGNDVNVGMRDQITLNKFVIIYIFFLVLPFSFKVCDFASLCVMKKGCLFF